jgi:hypothetical protein
MHRLELREIRRRNLDWIAGDWQQGNVLPRVQLVLVLDHLGSLPVVLDSGALH